MLTQEQIKQIENSFKHGDCLVFQIKDRGVFVAENVLKHRKEAMIEMQGCFEVDESCFHNDEYFGDTTGPERTFILDDPFADNENTIASIYYLDEIKEEIIK